MNLKAVEFHLNLKSTFFEQTVENLIRCGFLASDLVLTCLLMSHKMDTRLLCRNLMEWVFSFTQMSVCPLNSI